MVKKGIDKTLIAEKYKGTMSELSKKVGLPVGTIGDIMGDLADKGALKVRMEGGEMQIDWTGDEGKLIEQAIKDFKRQRLKMLRSGGRRK